MKRYLTVILLMGVIAFFPIKVHALNDDTTTTDNTVKQETVEPSEISGSDGNETITTTDEPEYHILDSEVATDDATVPSSDNQNIAEDSVTTNNGIVYKAMDAKAETANVKSDDKNNDVLYFAISSLAGVAIGGSLVYIIKK